MIEKLPFAMFVIWLAALGFASQGLIPPPTQPLSQGQGLRGLTTSAWGVIALLFWGVAGGCVGVCARVWGRSLCLMCCCLHEGCCYQVVCRLCSTLQLERPPLRPKLQAFDSNVSAAVVCFCVPSPTLWLFGVVWASGGLGMLNVNGCSLEGCQVLANRCKAGCQNTVDGCLRLGVCAICGWWLALAALRQARPPLRPALPACESTVCVCV